MRLIASDFITHDRPSPCDLRVLLKQNGEKEAEPSAFDEVLRRLGIRHEQEHLSTLGEHTDLSTLPLAERIKRTFDAIASGVAGPIPASVSGDPQYGRHRRRNSWHAGLSHSEW